MSVAYCRTPIGTLGIREDHGRITEVWFAGSGKSDAKASGAFRSRTLAKCAAELEDYFLGRLGRFGSPMRPQGTDFQKAVWRELARIPVGGTASYGEIARRVGRPRAIRAAAGAVGKNPIAILIPCHRVIAHDGSLGGYASGIRRKKWLLAHEKALASDGRLYYNRASQ